MAMPTRQPEEVDEAPVAVEERSVEFEPIAAKSKSCEN
jgi:hypothetical protein